MERNYCVHPGKVVKSILMSIDKTQKWLAIETGINKIVISNIIHGKRNVTTAFAHAFQQATGFSAETLLGQQNKYDLFVYRAKLAEARVIVYNDEKVRREDEVIVKPFNIKADCNCQLLAA